MAIYRYLDVSTCHVTEQDMRLLALEGNSAAMLQPIFSYPYPEGAFITGPDFTDLGEASRVDAECRAFGYSASFIKVLVLARLRECRMIRLDADGDDWDLTLDRHDW